MAREKKQRNKAIVTLRKTDPNEWSFTKLSEAFELDRATIHEIYTRDEDKFLDNTPNT